MASDVIHNLVEILVGTAQQSTRFYILDLCLLCLDSRKGIAMTGEECCLLTVSFESYGIWIY